MRNNKNTFGVTREHSVGVRLYFFLNKCEDGLTWINSKTVGFPGLLHFFYRLHGLDFSSESTRFYGLIRPYIGLIPSPTGRSNPILITLHKTELNKSTQSEWWMVNRMMNELTSRQSGSKNQQLHAIITRKMTFSNQKIQHQTYRMMRISNQFKIYHRDWYMYLVGTDSNETNLKFRNVHISIDLCL